jgi:hypothetical protein
MYKSVEPKIFKRILEKGKYELVAQDDRNWIMESNGHPIVIPQTMKEIPEYVIETMLGPSGIDETTFFKYLLEIDPTATATLSTPAPATAPAVQTQPEQAPKTESR